MSEQQLVIEQVTREDLLREIQALKATVAELHAQVQTSCQQIETAQAQIAHVVELAAPAIEQIAASPLLKMLGGKRA